MTGLIGLSSVLPFMRWGLVSLLSGRLICFIIILAALSMLMVMFSFSLSRGVLGKGLPCLPSLYFGGRDISL